jgi:hypothetical protein
MGLLAQLTSSEHSDGVGNITYQERLQLITGLMLLGMQAARILMQQSKLPQVEGSCLT